MRTICSLIVAVMLNQPTAVEAMCGEYHDCDLEPLYLDELDKYELEDRVYEAIEDAVGDCLEIIDPTKRLDCYDKGLTDFGFEVKAQLQ